MLETMKLSKDPMCSDVNLVNSEICSHSEHGKYAIEQRWAGIWCTMVCSGSHRLYKVNDGERHWVWAMSVYEIQQHWLREYGIDDEIIIEIVGYSVANDTMVRDEDDNEHTLLDIVVKEHIISKEFCVIASTVN